MSVRPLAVLLATLLSAVALTACGGDDGDSPDSGTETTAPFAEGLFVADSPDLDAAADDARLAGDSEAASVLERIASIPAGIWLTPEAHPAGDVGTFVGDQVAAAGAQTPVFVVYGIPDRDCTGDFSTGGLDRQSYGPWVQEIADQLGPGDVVVLEPDALAASTQCSGQGQRLRLLDDAADRLAGSGAALYLDAGHSDWIPPEEIARLLRRTGIEEARGFATNVSNYQPEAAEEEYAATLRGLLGDDVRYVIDTGRNGSPGGTGDPVQDWCNPPGRALGQEPRAVQDGTGLDAYLWIKPPAESDGTCHGGPPAGEVWPERAVDLAKAAGW